MSERAPPAGARLSAQLLSESSHLISSPAPAPQEAKIRLQGVLETGIPVPVSALGLLKPCDD